MVIYDSCLVIALSYREEILLSIHFEPITSQFNDKAFCRPRHKRTCRKEKGASRIFYKLPE